MKYSSQIPGRRSLRLKNYDYAQQIGCFVTLRTMNRECLFGEIRDGGIQLNDIGLMVRQEWNKLHENYHGLETDQFIVMPNHLHGIILLTAGAPPGNAPAISLPDVVHQFQSYTTARYLFGVALLNWPPFYDTLWQRNYYERTIRNNKELKTVRDFIRNNPLQWSMDKDNPI